MPHLPPLPGTVLSYDKKKYRPRVWTDRCAVAGIPRSGRTTLGGADARHANGVTAAEVSEWFDTRGALVVEGDGVLEALKIWLAAHPEGKPVDRVVFLSMSRYELSEAERELAHEARTVFQEIEAQLVARKVTVTYE
jgi:hypothetical protein